MRRMDSHGGPETLSRSAGLGQRGRSAVKVCPREQSRPDPGVPRAGAYLGKAVARGAWVLLMPISIHIASAT